MNKKITSLKKSLPAKHSWAKDTGFIPPKKTGSAAVNPHSVPTDSQAGDIKPLLKKLLVGIIATLNASAGIVRVLAPHGQTLRLISSAGLPDELLETGSSPLLWCETDCSKSADRGIYAANLSECKSRPNCNFSAYQIQSLISVPIESHATPGHFSGILTVFFPQPLEAFERAADTLQIFARMLSAVIEHDKSIRDAKRADLIEERQAIANDIHDSLAQTLVYARMRSSLLLESIRTGNGLMTTKYAQDVDEALEISQKNVRELITDFRCAMDPAGLLHALDTLTRQFCQRNDIALEYLNRVANIELPLEYEIQVFHIVQEALANIATHSGATHARLRVEHPGNYYVFTIEDNGSGGCTFTPVEGHYGMMIMRERAQRIGGEVKVESSNGGGTRVQLFFPEPGANWRAVNE